MKVSLKITDVVARVYDGFYATVDGVEYEFLGGENPVLGIACDKCGRMAEKNDVFDEWDEPEWNRIVYQNFPSGVNLCSECLQK